MWMREKLYNFVAYNTTRIALHYICMWTRAAGRADRSAAIEGSHTVEWLGLWWPLASAKTA